MGQNTQFNWITEGHVGDIGAYTRKDGRVIFRVRHNLGGKGVKTLLTQEHRLLMPNLVHAGQQILPYIHNAFSDRKPGESDINAFVSMNYDEASVYITRKMSRLGACVVDNFTVSQGPLQPVVMELENGLWVSDICVGDLTIDATTTVAQFAYAVVNSNPEGRFKVNDNLHLMRMTQYFDSMSVPRAQTSARKINLLIDDQTKLLDRMGAMGSDGLQVVERQGGRYLAFADQENSVVTYILARKQSNRWVTSTQTLRGKNEAVDAYSSRFALVDSIESYGGLTSNNWYQTGTTLNPLEDLILGRIDMPGSSSSGTRPGGGSGTGTGSDPTFTLRALVSPEGFGSVACSPAQMPVPRGTQVTFTATPASGKRFKQWSTGSTDPVLTVTAEADREYTATFETIPSGGEGGSGEIELGRDSSPDEDRKEA